tara:strand:+ start:1806 stop:3206 length:1401 start_codon:yes stop_codon:yes gene_type:complete
MGLLDFLKMPRSDHPDRKAALQGRSQIYNLLDNIIGFDDDRVTPGEAFGADLRENPVGLLSSGLQGATDDMRGLMFEGEAVQRPEDVLMMAAAPMAPNARGLLSRSPDVMNSNPLMGGGTSDPTQTGWTFKDVDRSLKTSKLENRRLAGDTSRVEEVPIRQLYATQPTVNSDFATTSSSAGEMPLVVRKNGRMFVQDGHHRLTKKAEDGSQTAKVRFIDLDNEDTSTPLLDWSPEKTGFVEADQDLLNELFAPSLPAPRNEAEAMAQKVLEMRAAGNAGDVTEDMMAAADDQYMYFNTPIPMDEASRMARARDMRFGVEYPLYRGDTVDHPYYQALYDDAIYTSTDPRVSEDYALPRGLISPLIGNRDNFAIDSSFDDFDADGFSEALADAYDSGKSGVNFQSVADGDAFSRHGKVIADTNAFLDPRDIRSRFARFDPEFRHLRNLSAGVGGLGLLGMSYPQEEQY